MFTFTRQYLGLVITVTNPQYPRALHSPLSPLNRYLRTSLGDTIHVWWIPRTTNGTLTAVLHHGAIGLMNQYEPAYVNLTSLGVNVAGYDYPFYGRSTGRMCLYTKVSLILISS